MRRPRAGALTDRLGWREDALEVDRAMARCLGGVIHNYLAEVLCSPQRAGRQFPDLDEVAEVPELVKLPSPSAESAGSDTPLRRAI